MAKHLTDKQKKRIIADYATLGTYSAVAKKHKTSETTVRRVVKSDPETADLVNRKKDENTEEVLAHLGDMAKDACDILDALLAALKDPEKLRRASLQSIATSFGIIVDKFTGTPGEVEKLKAEISKLKGDQTPQTVHPLIADLAEAMKNGGTKDAE